MYRTLLVAPYIFLLFVGLTIPSDGQHGFLSIKGLSFIVSLLTFGAFFLRPNYKEDWLQGCSAFLAGIGCLLLWFLIGLYQGETPLSSQLDQFKLFLVTLYFPFATYILLEGHFITIQTIFKTAFYAVFAYAFTKITLVSLHLLGIIDLWSLLEILEIRFMKMVIIEGLDRVQTSADITPPFLLFFALRADLLGISFSRTFKTLFAVLIFLSTFLSFSRVLLAVYAASLILATLTLSPRAIRNTTAASLLVLFLAYLGIGPTNVHRIIERRFLSQDTFISDEIRGRQIDALWNDFLSHPFLGKGLGAHTPEYIRDAEFPHSYEVQWLAFLLQFGIIGSLLIGLPLFALAQSLLQTPTRFRLATLASYLMFLLAGLTNPFLISLASGILYTLFYLPSRISLPRPSPLSHQIP